ncbi:hypothetical protein QFZ81_000153 [Paenibacillus sp. V4I9]|uniref:methyltransferase n=1 Tax=Paenibacillus sp. V4I9 TaxID=3042308 RepID=UPI00278B2D61|nr:methyltransferase [Paenibacillus sp. V4I9]MDQ0885065.1 hypothetical protein [Paenibacillus sp. V4I9]
MDKILVELFVPAVNQSYDVYIPFTSKMHEIEKLLTKAITELSAGYYAVSENTVICERTSGSILDINLSAQELGLLNGSKLMLI